MKKSRIFGEFLVINNVIEPHEISFLLREQKADAYYTGLLNKLYEILGPDKLEELISHQIEEGVPLDEAAVSLRLLSRTGLEKINIETKRFRKPIGYHIIKNRFLSQDELEHWLYLFINQQFDDDGMAIDLLRRTPLFSGLDDETLKMISPLMTYRYYPSNETIYREGFDSKYLYLIESGLVRMSLYSHSGEIELRSLHPGEYFGLNGVLSDDPYVETTVAVMNTSVWRLAKGDLARLMHRYPAIAITASELVSNKMKSILGSIKSRKPDLNTRNITAIFFEGMDKTVESLAKTIALEMSNLSGGDVLIIYSHENSKVQQMDYGKGAVLQDYKPMHIESSGDGSLFGIHFPDMEQYNDINNLSYWLRDHALNFKSVIILAETGTSEFHHFVRGIRHRSVQLIRKNASPMIESVSGRDRTYLISSGDIRKDGSIHSSLIFKSKGTEFTVAPHVIRKNNLRLSGRLIARWLLGRSMGLAFGGGGARAMAQIGVLQALEDEGIFIDAVSGCSAGSIVAGAYASGMDSHAIEDLLARELFNKLRHPFSDYTVPLLTGSVSMGRKYKRALKRCFGDTLLIGTAIPFLPVSTDFSNGTEYIVREGPLWEAVMASGSVPGLLPLFKHRGIYLADGGLVNNIPASPLKKYGCDYVISIDISEKPGVTPLKPRSFINVMSQVLDILINESLQKNAGFTDFEVKPDVNGYSSLDFRLGSQIIERGLAAMRSRMEDLKESMEKEGIFPS